MFDHAAEIEEVGVRGGALGQIDVAPLGNELCDGHVMCVGLSCRPVPGQPRGRQGQCVSRSLRKAKTEAHEVRGAKRTVPVSWEARADWVGRDATHPVRSLERRVDLLVGRRGKTVLVIGWLIALRLVLDAQPGIPVRVSVQGETNLAPQFVQTLKQEGRAAGLDVSVVERSTDQIDYRILLAQESTIGSAAAAVIVLDRDGNIAASVVRSGRLSGKGAINACTKEVVKKIAILKK